MKLYRWRIDGSAFPGKGVDVVAPDISEAVRLAVGLFPNAGIWEDGIKIAERHESIEAIWAPPTMGPREPTIDEQARAEVEALIEA